MAGLARASGLLDIPSASGSSTHTGSDKEIYIGSLILLPGGRYVYVGVPCCVGAELDAAPAEEEEFQGNTFCKGASYNCVQYGRQAHSGAS